MFLSLNASEEQNLFFRINSAMEIFPRLPGRHLMVIRLSWVVSVTLYEDQKIWARNIRSESPITYLDFQRMFPDERGCLLDLENMRWPNSFVCQKCSAIGEPFRIAHFLIGCIMWFIPFSLLLWAQECACS